MRNVAYFNGIPVDLKNNQEIYELVTCWLYMGDKSRQIVTLNAVILISALRNPFLKETIQRADLVTIDGYGIEWVLQKNGYPCTQRLRGVDLTRALLIKAVQSGSTVYFFGGTPKIARLIQETFSYSWPGLLISGIRDGYGYYLTRNEIIKDIIDKQPHLLFVGLGSPEQELFLAEVLPYLERTIGVGVGGTLAVLTGVKQEAPRFIRERGLEWCFRMFQEPQKIRLIPDLICFWYRFLR